MSEFHETHDLDGDAGFQEAEPAAPGDAESNGLNHSRMVPEGPAADEVDDGALADGPMIPVQPADSDVQAGTQMDTASRRIGTVTTDHGAPVEAKEPTVDAADTARPADLRVESSISDDQQAFWNALEQTSAQAGRAATVRETTPGSDAALEQEYQQYEIFNAVQDYNAAAARGIFDAGRSALEQQQFAAADTADPFFGEAHVHSQDGSVSVDAQALDDEMAAAILEEEPQGTITLDQPWHTNGPVSFTVTTRQEVARQLSESAGTDEPITLNVVNEFLVCPDNPGVAHWLRSNMETMRSGEPDGEHLGTLMGNLMRPLDEGIPDEPANADPAMRDTFFRSLDAFGMHSAMTQLEATELGARQPEDDEPAPNDRAAIEGRLYEALDRAGYPRVETADTTADQELDDQELPTAEQVKVAKDLVEAMSLIEYDPSDEETVSRRSDTIANCALVAARVGEWDTVDVSRDHLESMEEKVALAGSTHGEAGALTRVLLYQQELGLNDEAAEVLKTRLEFEKAAGDAQPMLDLIISECDRIGVSPMPWIENYSRDPEEQFRRTHEHYVDTYRTTGSTEAEDNMTRTAMSLVENDSHSANLICDIAPMTITELNDTALQTRLMDTYLQNIEDIEITTDDYENLITVGQAAINNFRYYESQLQTARNDGDFDTEFRLMDELPEHRARVALFDEAVAKAVSRLSTDGNLSYQHLSQQMYWTQGVEALGIQPNQLPPLTTVDGLIGDILTKVKPDKVDGVLGHMAGVSIDNGNYIDARKFITRMKPASQPYAYVKYWATAQTPEDLVSLDPNRPSDVSDEMQQFEQEFGRRRFNIDDHYAVGQVMLDDPKEFTEPPDPDANVVSAHEQHTVELAQETQRVAKTLANLIPRSTRPGMANSPNTPLYRVQLDQLLAKLEEHDPDMARSVAAGLLMNSDIREARDKQLTFKLARILARSGNPEDYNRAWQAINNIKGGMNDTERRRYKLQLADAFSDAIAA